MLQRELTREFPELAFYRAVPGTDVAECWPQAEAPGVCILDWGLGVREAFKVALEVEARWPQTVLLVFCREAAVRERFEAQRRDLSRPVGGVAAELHDLLDLAKRVLRGPVPSAPGAREKEQVPAAGVGCPPRCQTDVLDSLPFGVALVDARTRRVIYANATLGRWLGIAPAGLTTLRLEDLHSGDAVRRIVASSRVIRRRPSLDSIEAAISVPGRGGTMLDVLVGEAFMSGEGAFSVFYVDATERRAVERKLRRMGDAVANAASGREFFRSLVTGLARVLDVDMASVCRVQAGTGQGILIRSLATIVDGEVTTDQAMDIAGHPAERVLKHQLICVTRNFRKEYPHAAWMTERQVESYMGLPVTGVNGEVIGMIQILHREPLAKTKDLRAVLLIFATRVAAEMVRLANEEALQERERLMSEAEHVSGLGSWEWSIAADRVSVSEEGLRIIGWESLPPEANYEWGLARIHPDDQAKARAMVENAIRQQGSFEETFRVVRPGGEFRRVQLRGRFIGEGDRGSADRLAGIFLDVTKRLQLSRSNEAFSRLGQQLSSAKTKVEAARIMVRVTAEVFEVDAAAFGLRDVRAPDRFVTILNIDSVDGVLQEFEPVVSRAGPTPIQRRVMARGAQLFHRDRENPGELEAVPFGVVARKSATIMVVPIRYHEECIGIFAIHSYRNNAYSEEDLAVLQALADYGAGALLRVDAEDEARKNHDLLRLVIDSLPAHVAYVDEHQRYLMVNRHYEHWFARPRVDIEGRSLEELLPADMRQPVLTDVARALKGESVDSEIATDCIGGVRRNLHLVYVPHVLHGGRVAGLVMLITDITSLRSVEVELRESVVRTQSILDNAAAVVFVKDLQGRYQLVNKLWEKVMALNRAEAIGRRTEELHPVDVAQELIANDRKVLESNAPAEIEEVVERHGTKRTFLAVKFPLIDTGGRTYGLCGIATDITRRKAMEQSMRQVTRRLKTAQSIARFGHWEWDIATRAMWFSEETCRLFGLDPADFVPSWEFFLALVHAEDRAAIQQARERCLQDLTPYSILHRVILPNQGIRYFQQYGEAVFDDESTVTAVAGVLQDVTEQHLTELALRAAEEKFRRQCEAMPLPTFIWQYRDGDFVLTEANPAAQKFSEGAIGQFFGETASAIFFDLPEIVTDFLRCYHGKSYFTRELPAYRMRTTGQRRHLRAHVHYVAPDLVVLHVDDLTERVEAEARQRAMLQLIPDRLFRLDQGGCFLDYHASRPEEMLLDPRAVIGRNFREVLPRGPARLIERALEKAAATGTVQVIHYTLTKDGKIHYLEGRMIHCDNGEFLAMVHDISEEEYRRAIGPTFPGNSDGRS